MSDIDSLFGQLRSASFSFSHGKKKGKQNGEDQSEISTIQLQPPSLMYNNACFPEPGDCAERALDNRVARPWLGRESAQGVISEVKQLMTQFNSVVELCMKQKSEIESLQEQLLARDAQIYHFEDVVGSFDESIKNHEEKLREDQFQLVKVHNAEVESLSRQIGKLTQQNSEQQARIDALIVQSLRSDEKLGGLTRMNDSLQSSLNTLNIDMVKLKSIHQGEVSERVLERSLKGVLTAKKAKHTILQCLSFEEVLQLRLVNREFNLIITRDFHLQTILIGHLADSYNRRTQGLLKRANHFKQVAEAIPDEVLRVAIVKYLCSKVEIGDALKPTLLSINSLIEGAFIQEVQSSNLTGQGKSPVNTVDLLGDINEAEAPTGVSVVAAEASNQVKLGGGSGESKTSKTFGFMRRLLSKGDAHGSTAVSSNNSSNGSNSSGIGNGQSSSSIINSSNNSQAKRSFVSQNNIDLIDEEHANQLLRDMNVSMRIDSGSVRLFNEERDVLARSMDIEAAELRQKLSDVRIRCIHSEKIGVFVNAMENGLVELFVGVRSLQAEAKTLYDLQSYLSFELIETKRVLGETTNALEDSRAAKIAAEQMKDFLSGKLRDTERKNLHMDTVFLKNTKLIQELNAHQASQNERITGLEKARVKADANLKILAKELRSQLRKHAATSEKYDHILTNMNFLKEALTNFNVVAVLSPPQLQL